MKQSNIRNFSIIAHIDHGKSTLADRFLQVTNTVDEKKIHKQHLDLMDLEQEKGITIKLTPVTMDYELQGEKFQLNLIDTPGHVDFTYEVSRSLAACEGAILVVDAAQGIEAQTLANIYLAMDQDLVIIPVLNKVDLPSAEPERRKKELVKVFGFDENEILEVSAKTGLGVENLIQRVIEKIPPPSGDPEATPRALIFDSKYDAYKGALAYIRVVDGTFTSSSKIQMLAKHVKSDVVDIGKFRPEMFTTKTLVAGEVGYIATGLKDVSGLRVGDTISLFGSDDVQPLEGYTQVQPKVYAGIYPVDGNDYPDLRDAIERLQLNDASLIFEPETSTALGFGFRCGFLGLLHMDIIQERLEREYNLDLVFTAPNVKYKVLVDGQKEYMNISNPSDFPEDVKIAEAHEPWVKLSIITPSRYIGAIMKLIQRHRGEFGLTEYIDEERVNLFFEMPLSEVIIDFYDELKGATSGYATMDYEPIGMKIGKLQKLKILVHDEEVDAFVQIVPIEKATEIGHYIVRKLKEVIPRQNFEFKIQAKLGGKIIQTVKQSGYRKDVIAKLYGGDRTRKDKLLKKQAIGKKRAKMIGSVEIPQQAFFVLLGKGDGK